MSKKGKPRRLGRGLNSLIQGKPTTKDSNNASVHLSPAHPQHDTEPTGSPKQVAIDDIATNPYQPRREFDPTELAELAQSIRQDGILQPLILAPANEDALEGATDKPFVLIAGERRLRASKQAGLSKVPCIVREATQQQMVEWAIIENIQRADLNPIEKARAYQEYMDRYELTQEQTSERLGQARTTVANYLRLNDLTDETQEMIASKQLSFGHAKVLAGLVSQPERQVNLARRAIAEGLSVRKLEQLLAADPTSKKPATANKPAGETSEKPAYVRDVERQLMETIGTRVNVLPSRKKNAGKIVVEYYNLDDFDRIAGLLGLSDDV